MSPRTIFFTISIGIVAYLSSNHNFTSFPPLLIHYLNVTISPGLISLSYCRSHHSHHSHDKKKLVSICDDFPKNFTPPDTNTTSVICVDRNGCCNFTTVQAAVDAVGALSTKRTIIWINNGIY